MHECKDNADYETNKYYASSAYIVGSDPYDIMVEVYNNGPVEVAFDVFEVKFAFGYETLLHLVILNSSF